MDEERTFDIRKLLLWLIVIVAIIIVIIVIVNMVKKRRSTVNINEPVSLTDTSEKYQTVISDIERGANTFVLANREVLIFKKTGSNHEYSCVTVGTLTSDSYLSRNVLGEKVSSKKVVKEDDYVYVERNTSDMEITKLTYIQDSNSDYAKKCADFPAPATGKEIKFEFSPASDIWSGEKEVTIAYKENSQYRYYYTYDHKSECLSGCSADGYIKKIKLTENGEITANIKDTDGNLIYSNKILVDKIDNEGPNIKLASNDKLEYTGSFSLNLIVQDNGSGINRDTFTKDDIEVYIGDNKVTNYSLSYNSNDSYTLKISPDGKLGKLKLIIKKESILDNVKNSNNEVVLNPDITVKAASEEPKDPTKPTKEAAKNYIIYPDTNYDYNKAKFSDTLAKAVDLAQNGNIIVLNVDNFTDSGVTISKNIIINTNGMKLSLTSPIINTGELLIQGNTTGILAASSNWRAKNKDWLIENYGRLVTNYVNIENTSNLHWVIANANEYICQDSTKVNGSINAVAAVKGTVTISNGCNVIAQGDAVQITSSTNSSYVILSGGVISSQDVGVRIANANGNFVMNSGQIGANYGVVAYNGTSQLLGGSIYGNNVGAYITDGTIIIGKNDGKIEETAIHIGSVNNFAIGVFEGGQGHYEWYDGTLWANMETTYYGTPLTGYNINKKKVSIVDIPYSYQNYLSYQ